MNKYLQSRQKRLGGHIIVAYPETSTLIGAYIPLTLEAPK
jgi:hypothetical protein